MEEMATSAAIEAMLAASSRNACSVSRALGKSAGYVGTIICRGSCPQADTLASIADEMGFALLLESADGSMRIRIAPAPSDSGAAS